MNSLLLIGINSKFTHSNLAIRYMRAYADVPIFECSINDDIFAVYRRLCERTEDFFCFSVYIWNVEFIKRLCPMLKAAKPNLKIVFGGPEAGYDKENLFSACPYLFGVITGEGEEAVLALKNCGTDYSSVPNFSFRENEKIISNPLLKTNLSKLKFPYTKEDLSSELKNRILYFETARGCLFHCTYCLSSAEGKTRFFPMDYVKRGLLFFMENRVPLVKFVDRTFNESAERATEIVSFILEHNVETRFHFELAPQLLTKEFVDLCVKKPEFFQFEMGIQTTNRDTMIAIRRPYDLEKTAEKIKAVPKSIHVHLDLIAGLPYETIDTFHQGFNFVYALRPQMLQLGFLKLIKHTSLFADAEKYDIKTTAFPPFETLSTATMSAIDIISLKKTEDAVERFYNSGAFSKTLSEIKLQDPYLFYKSLGEKLCETENKAPLSRAGLYTFLYEQIKDVPNIKQSLVTDFLTHNRKAPVPDVFLDSVEDAKKLHKKLAALPQFKDIRFRLVFAAGRAFAVSDNAVEDVTDLCQRT